MAKFLLKNKVPKGIVLNINVPYSNPKNIKGSRITRQGNAYFKDEFEKRIDPRKNIYFWLKGEMIDNDKSIDYDGKAIADNYISITPINFNFTDESYFNELNKQISDE